VMNLQPLGFPKRRIRSARCEFAATSAGPPPDASDRIRAMAAPSSSVACSAVALLPQFYPLKESASATSHWYQMGSVTWVDVATVVAAVAGLWALAFAWLTYVMAVRTQNKEEFLALKSVVEGLRVELDVMRPWTGAGGPGYSKEMKPEAAPADWYNPTRRIWKFGFDAVASLSSSPYLYRLRDIVGPFARLNFSISRLFQLYDEYRSFANSHPDIQSGWLNAWAGVPVTIKTMIFDFNFQIHVNLIGGADSDDPMCLYRAYDGAIAALNKFDADLRARALPWWFRIGHVVSAVCFVSGIFLLFELFR